jgi:hypothetical protein
MPRPTAVSNSMNAETTPSPSSVAVSRILNPAGSVAASRAVSMSAMPSRPSSVLMFQVNATRSRQKESTANLPTIRSMSRAASASSKSASHASMRSWGEVAAARASTV